MIADWIAENFGKFLALLMLSIALCLWRVDVGERRERSRADAARRPAALVGIVRASVRAGHPRFLPLP